MLDDLRAVPPLLDLRAVVPDDFRAPPEERLAPVLADFARVPVEADLRVFEDRVLFLAAPLEREPEPLDLRAEDVRPPPPPLPPLDVAPSSFSLHLPDMTR